MNLNLNQQTQLRKKKTCGETMESLEVIAAANIPAVFTNNSYMLFLEVTIDLSYTLCFGNNDMFSNQHNVFFSHLVEAALL